MPPAVEQAYRRGFTQGFLEAVRLAADGLSLDALRRFGCGRLWRWRYTARMRREAPPLPTCRGRAKR